jgi:hypothetical protein
MILVVRILLIALLLVGSTGSALCQLLCAQPADFQATAPSAPASEMAGPDHGGCHAAAAPPEPLSKGSGEPCERDCCTVLTRATPAPLSDPVPTSAASPMPAGVDLDQARIGPGLLRHSRPAVPLESPFQFRNPPLLI